MTEKLTLKKLSGELETLRMQVLKLEQQLKDNLETTLEKAVARLGTGFVTGKSPEHGPSVDAEQRQRLIAEQAYLIAEQRGFQGGDPAQDWARAEKLVNDQLLHKSAQADSAVRAKRPATKKPSAKSSRLAK